MRRLVLLVCLLFASTYALPFNPFVRADAARAVRKIKEATALLKNAMTIKAASLKAVPHQFKTTEVSEACQAAVYGLYQAYATCGTIPDPGSMSFETQLNNFCTDTCVNGVEQAVEAVVSACNNDNDRAIFADEDFDLAMRRSVGAVKAMCMKENDKFCILKVQEAADLDLTTATKQKLDAFCSPCLQKVFITLSEYSGGDEEMSVAVAALDALCFKINGEYCMLKIQQAWSQWDDLSDSDTPDFNVIGQVFCQPCLRGFLGKLLSIIPPEEASGFEFVEQLFGSLCVRDENGVLCLSRYEDLMEFSMTIGFSCPTITPDSECPSGCKDAVSGGVSRAGCCINTLGEELLVLKPWAESKCGVQIPGQCPHHARVTAKLHLRNLRWSWVQNHKEEVKAGLKKDLAGYFGLTSGDIEITNIAQHGGADPAARSFVKQADATGGVQVEYEAFPFDGSHANYIRSRTMNIEAEGYLPTIAALPLEAREDPTQPITFATPDASDVVVEGAAAGVKAGIVVAAVVMLAAVANLF